MHMRHKQEYNRASNAAIGNTKEVDIRQNKVASLYPNLTLD